MHSVWIPRVVSAFVAAAVPAMTIGAQAPQLEVAGGLAVPLGAWGATRTPGPLVRASATLGAPTRVVRFRAEVEGAWLLDQIDRTPGAVGSSQQGNLRAVSAIGSVLVGGTRAGLAPYVVVGLAAQRLTVAGARNPYGTTAGLRAGAGLRWRFRRVVLHGEVTPHWALTDFGTGRDFGVGAYVPAVIGLSF